MKKSKKTKKPKKRDFHYDKESFAIDDVLSKIKEAKKNEKKKRIGLTV